MNMTMREIIRAYRDRTPGPIGPHRFFSVLVPLVERDGEVCLLFEVRARDMESQPGEVCFPGGHMEPGESAAACALRETAEEIGIPPERVQLIGPGDILYGYANYTLYTHLGIVDYADYARAKLSAAEVDEIFLVPLETFHRCPPQIEREKIYTEISPDFPFAKVGIDETYPWRTGSWDIPVYEVEGHVIWGLTARITQQLVATLWDSRDGTEHGNGGNA